jgi:hypothetical protein
MSEEFVEEESSDIASALIAKNWREKNPSHF